MNMVLLVYKKNKIQSFNWTFKLNYFAAMWSSCRVEISCSWNLRYTWQCHLIKIDTSTSSTDFLNVIKRTNFFSSMQITIPLWNFLYKQDKIRFVILDRVFEAHVFSCQLARKLFINPRVWLWKVSISWYRQVDIQTTKTRQGFSFAA